MTQTFTIPPTAIPANTLVTSPAQTISATVHGATVRLTDPNGTWPTSIDPTRHIICWGTQTNLNDGNGWRWGLYQGDPGSTGVLAYGETTLNPNPALQIPFGSRDRFGNFNMALTLSSSSIVDNAGAQVRLAIMTDAAYTFGATITVS